MNKKEEILKELRQIRMQIAFTPTGEEKNNLVKKADELHKNYARSLFKEKEEERKRGRK